MVCNHRIYKGSSAEITVPVVPGCFSAQTDDIVVEFYTVGDDSIEFSVSAGTLTMDGDYGTVYFAPEQLEALEDGQLRYTSTLDGSFVREWESVYFLLTPQPHTVINFVTTETVQELVDDAIDEENLVHEEDLEGYAKLTDIPDVSGYATKSELSQAVVGMVTSSTITTIWVGSEAEYDAISNKDNQTLYIIK